MSGLSASPAVMPMSSMPPKENITTVRDRHSPHQTLGRKAPCDQRLAIFSGKGTAPPKIRYNPSTIIIRMAVILMRAIQNSISPYMRTLMKLATVMTTRHTRALTHWGRSGSQKFM